MSGDKRSVSTDALETLGTIIDEKAGRDAIHIAVLPMLAAHDLRPGQDVGLMENGLAGPIEGQNLGIVDPFLQKGPKKGQRFWMLIYPRQITSLRHVWAHPAIPEAATPEYCPPGIKAARATESEKWLRNFCAKNDCPSYEVIIAVATEGDSGEGYEHSFIDGEYFHSGGADAHGDIPPEFWDHVERITGRKQLRRPSYFTCSC